MEPGTHVGQPPLQVAEGPDGTVTYLVHESPAGLPPVRGRDLSAALDAAREAASGAWLGAARRFRFRAGDGTVTDLALQDRDARCWAAGVDRTAGLGTMYGLSLCLRLLALIELVARTRWAAALARPERGGPRLDPALLRVAATVELTSEARFDETRFRAGLATLPAPAGVAL